MMARSARFHNRKISAQSQGRCAFLPARNDRGIALLVSLMLLTLMSVMSLIMVLTVSPDMLINGYYGNFRGSFYAADSGLNIARQQLINQIQSSTYVNMTPCVGWGTGAATGCTALPLDYSTGSGGAAGLVIANVLSTYGSFSSLNSGQAASSWPGSFELVNTAACPSTFTPASGAPEVKGTITLPNGGPTLPNWYRYRFNYQLCSQGRAQSSQQVNTSEYGVISVDIKEVALTTQQTTVSFASFGAFIANYPPCTGSLVPGTMTGPMFAIGAWQFGTSGSYIFTDPVGQTNANADFYFGSNCIQSPNSNYTYKGTKIAPTFQGGFNLGQATPGLPGNDFSQKWAVLDGKGCGEGTDVCGDPTTTPPTPVNSDLNAHLRDINGAAYSSTGSTTSGVYLPYSCVSGTCTVNGGGIYVENSANLTTNITLSTSTDASGNLTQIYTIKQGSTTTTVTIPVWNPTANAAPSPGYTQVDSGSTHKTLVGVPMNTVTSTPQQGTMLYVDGNISSLSGPGQGVAAIQDHSQVTITAGPVGSQNGDIEITGDIVYAHEPVTRDVSDTLIAGNDSNQVLGVFTSAGNINLSSTYSNNNLQVDGALAAIGQNCASNSCGFTQSGNTIKTFTNVGGQIQYNIFGANINTENTYFDRRFTSKAGFAPPWFPSTKMPQNAVLTALAPSVIPQPTSRMSWVTSPQ